MPRIVKLKRLNSQSQTKKPGVLNLVQRIRVQIQHQRTMVRHDLKLGSREIQSALVESPNIGEHFKLDDRVPRLGVRQVATSSLYYAPLLTVPLPQDKAEFFHSEQTHRSPAGGRARADEMPELAETQAQSWWR